MVKKSANIANKGNNITTTTASPIKAVKTPSLIENKAINPMNIKKKTKSLTPFARLVYACTKKIPKGQVSTYKLIAKAIGHPGAYRAVGSSLCQNPFAPDVPCHRVVSSDATMGGFCGKTGMDSPEIQRKISMLEKEGVTIQKGKVLKQHIWESKTTIIFKKDEITDEALGMVLQ